MKIPKDIYHIPLLNEDLSINPDCMLWQSSKGALEFYLYNFYPECYNYTCQELKPASSAESLTQTLGARIVALDVSESIERI